jgi:hypothetical protein
VNPLPHYPGSKGGAGVDKRLVSLMPPHRVYVEAFLGGGAVLRLKRPAELQVGIDQDASVVSAWRPAATPGLTLAAALAGDSEPRGIRIPTPRKAMRTATSESAIAAASAGNGDTADGPPGVIASNGGAADRPRLCIAQADFLELLSSPAAVLQEPDTLVYCDPPYLRGVRTKLFYACELAGADRHARLLLQLSTLRCMAMISHYPCKLYNVMLRGWRRIQYRCMTRGGPRIEACYLNFPAPATLHDARFAGDGFRERERMKRLSRRWEARFAGMAAVQRQIVAAALARVDRTSLEAALKTSADFAAQGERR